MVLVGFGAGRCPMRRFLSDSAGILCQAFRRERRGGADTGPRWGDRSDIASLVPKDVDVWFEARRGRSWRYNSDSAWGGGYFARFSEAASAQGEPSLRKEVRFGVVYEVERVKPVDAMYLSVPHEDEEDEEDEGDEKPVIGYRNSGVTLETACAVAFGAFGGGHVEYRCRRRTSKHCGSFRVCARRRQVGTPDAETAQEIGMKGFDTRGCLRRGGRVAVEPSKRSSLCSRCSLRVSIIVVVTSDAGHQIQHVDYIYVFDRSVKLRQNNGHLGPSHLGSPPTTTLWKHRVNTRTEPGNPKSAACSRRPALGIFGLCFGVDSIRSSGENYTRCLFPQRPRR